MPTAETQEDVQGASPTPERTAHAGESDRENPAESARSKRSATPRVWVIMGYRAGERTQIVALAKALGWPFEIKEPRHTLFDFVPGLLRRKSLAGLVKDDRAMLGPAWPELVISAGMRNEPICRWIKARSGNTAKLVHIGRPWARLENFDLVITTPQYRLPDRANVLQNVGTLHQVTPATLQAAAANWLPRFQDLPRPHISVMVGGNSGPYTLGSRAATRLGRVVSRMAEERRGSALLTTSARTPRSSVRALQKALTCPSYVFEWSRAETANPYLGLLAAADEIVVTSDSVSMLSEAVATRKPVYIFDLGATHPVSANTEPSQNANGNESDAWLHRDFRLTAQLYRLLMAIGPQRLTRDLDLFHRSLVTSGRAAWLGSTSPPATGSTISDIDRAVNAVRSLFVTAAPRKAGI